jgi:hypothetical protein
MAENIRQNAARVGRSDTIVVTTTLEVSALALAEEAIVTCFRAVALMGEARTYQMAAPFCATNRLECFPNGNIRVGTTTFVPANRTEAVLAYAASIC